MIADYLIFDFGKNTHILIYVIMNSYFFDK